MTSRASSISATANKPATDSAYLELYNRMMADVAEEAPLAGALSRSLGVMRDAYRLYGPCLLYTSPSPRDRQKSRMPSSA